MIAPWAFNLIDFFCLLSMCFSYWFKLTWKKISKRSKMRLAGMTLIFLLSTIDLIFSSIKDNYPYFSNLMRPVVVMIMMRQVRQAFLSILLDIKDSLTILLAIFVYILFFSIFAEFLFKDSFEGFALMPDLSNSYYQLLILLTTCNFPNIMLPAYNAKRSNSIFFLVYLMIGLHFLFKVLLAVIFDNYRRRLEARSSNEIE